MPRHSYRSGRTSALLLVLLASIAQARASVVVTGTRVIYPGEAREKTVQLSNRDAFPNVVQAWVDIDAPDAPPDQADAPFLVNPAVFRMAPDSGQTLRIGLHRAGPAGRSRIAVPSQRPADPPPRNSSHADRNQMLLMLRNRLKLFYRPAGIQGRPEDLPGQLRFALVRRSAGWAVRVDNPSGYYASFASATLSVGQRRWRLRSGMLEPRSHAEWQAETREALPPGRVRLHALLINDYGAHMDIRHDLSP
ncbi:fimbrial biogenesis chaperone [Pseudomonas aeruginosa]|uniref:fimbrial biogenesis chaperone n=2 Tax=Pseudomonas aeruginosa TaxID=287 RepID=UPI003D07AF41